MADTKPPAEPAGAAGKSGPGAPSTAPKAPPKPTGNPALRMMGIPMLPKKLPSRNWMIFWTLTTSLSAAIIYDKREKTRATAKWAHAVSCLANEPLRDANDMPRKITVLLESPPGDGLRVAQDHFIEYARPILAASGIDWEFVQGRQQGDVRAAVAEKIRRARKLVERPEEDVLPMNDKAVLESRKRSGIPEYDGVKGDLVVGRHTWKEYIRGLHEGWLGPLDPPAAPSLPGGTSETPQVPLAEAAPKDETTPADDAAPKDDDAAPQEAKDGDNKEEKKDDAKDKKPERPPQPPSYNSTADYSSANIPHHMPAQFHPSAPIEFPHVLGFSSTFTRLRWYFTRRKLADRIGRDVAAVCFAASRGWDESGSEEYPQLKALENEEQYWPKSVFKVEEEKDSKAKDDGEDKVEEVKPPKKEKIWPVPIVADPRIVSRMRQFELLPEDEKRAMEVVVPETEIEGWLKGNLRKLGRWGVNQFRHQEHGPNVGDVDSEK